MTLVQKSPTHIYTAKEEVISDMQGPCERGYHVPLKSEWEGVVNAGVSLGAWTTSSGKTNFCTYMKIPMAGMRGTSSSTSSQGSQGIYWACDFEGAPFAYNLYIMSDGRVYVDSSAEIVGGSIRPFKDTPVTPDSSWTAIYQGSGTAGIYYSSSLGLISISSNGTTRYTIADKNLGATTVYTYGNTLSETNCGKFYQRGNNYGFAWTGNVTTSSTKVDASTYGPGNYYESSTFITGSSAPYNWDSSNNDNLRGGVTQGSGTVTVDTEIKAVYLGETKVRPAYKPRTFTITRTEKSDMSSGWTYSDDAAGLTAGDGAFDDFFGYSAVLLNTSGVETAEMKQSGGVFTGAMTTLGNITSGDNVMIKFPVRGIKMSKSGSTVTLSITEELDKDGYQYYAHSTGTLSNPGTPKDAFYLGTYKGYINSTTLKSWSGKTPAVSTTQSNFCTYAKNNGTGYNIEGFYQRMYINALYMMKYGNPNSQSVVGKGYTEASSAISTGNTNSQTSATYGSTSSGTTQCRLFGVEDRWGNVAEFIGGVYTNSSKVLYAMLTGWNGSISGGESTGTTVTQYSSYACLSSIAGTNKAMLSPISTVNNSSMNTYYSDAAYVYASKLMAVGGAYNYYGYAGNLCWEGRDASGGGAYHSQLGARLMYL